MPRLTAGRIVYLGYHWPRAWFARCRREGGPWEQFLDARGRREMIAAAAVLPPTAPVSEDAPEIHVLTGKKFWYQTAFCLWSLRRQIEARPVFVDDGSFNEALAVEAGRIFPGCRILRATAIEQRLNQVLPTSQFPFLRRQRQTYVHLRKLTDVHAGEQGWRVVIDSDMLFFRPPDVLSQWLEAPSAALHMVDVKSSYGYPPATLRELAGGPVPERVNVGVLGLRSEAIDWGVLEGWCRHLIARHGTSYYLEQALVSLLLTRQDAIALPAHDYQVMPAMGECRAPAAVLHHYVDLSKRGYFRHAWHHICH